jgi:hypothetical protein
VLGKLCAPPAKGGSASGLIEYLVGYAVAEKGATREQITEALDGVYAEAEDRPDLGVDIVWSPATGGGTRPSSIQVRNCASFSTASLEIDADGARNAGIRSSAMHFVWSWNERETGFLTDEQAHRNVGEVLGKLGLSHHRSVVVVHRDTDNLHVHCAVGAVDPGTGLAYDRTGLHRRMAWAEREVELANGLDHDRGLAVVQDAGLETAHVRWADPHELAAWRAERRDERLVRQERRSFEGYRERDGTFERYVDASLAPRLVTALDLDKQRLYEADVIEPLHTLQVERVNEAREAYHERKRDIEASAVSMEERLDGRREALREMRSAITAAYRELRPQPFGEWLQDREERHVHSRPSTRQQERSVKREHSREQSFARAEQLAQSENLDLRQ